MPGLLRRPSDVALDALLRDGNGVTSDIAGDFMPDTVHDPIPGTGGNSNGHHDGIIDIYNDRQSGVTFSRQAQQSAITKPSVVLSKRVENGSSGASQNQGETGAGTAGGESKEDPKQAGTGIGTQGGESKDDPKKTETSTGSGEQKDDPKETETGTGGGERKDDPKETETGTGGGERKEDPKQEGSGTGGGETKDPKQAETGTGGGETKDPKQAETGTGGGEPKEGTKQAGTGTGAGGDGSKDPKEAGAGTIGGETKNDPKQAGTGTGEGDTTTKAKPTPGGPVTSNPSDSGPTSVWLQQYTAARAAVQRDLDTFRVDLDEILRMLDTHIHVGDFEIISTNNQCARQYNASLDDRNKTKLAPLMDRKGTIIKETGTTIEILEKLSPEKKQAILEALGTTKEQLHWVVKGGKKVPNSELLKRQLRVAVGLPAVPFIYTIS